MLMWLYWIIAEYISSFSLRVHDDLSRWCPQSYAASQQWLRRKVNFNMSRREITDRKKSLYNSTSVKPVNFVALILLLLFVCFLIFLVFFFIFTKVWNCWEKPLIALSCSQSCVRMESKGWPITVLKHANLSSGLPQDQDKIHRLFPVISTFPHFSAKKLH